MQTAFRKKLAIALKQKIDEAQSQCNFDKEFKEKNPSIHQLIYDDQKNPSPFAQVWSKIILSIHTYNFFTVFFFLGIPGFPTELWLALEISTELVIILDFGLRWVLRITCPEIWDRMWLLHDKSGRSNFQFAIRLIGSLPTSSIISAIYRKEIGNLTSVKFALIRCLKLFRLRQIKEYFTTVEIQHQRKRKTQFLRMFQTLYYFLLATHFIGCVWLIVGRLDPEQASKGWLRMAKFNDGAKRDATVFEKYVEAVFFVVATMTGLGYGNLVPSTNLEWVVDGCIMVTGVSVYINFFSNFMVDIYMSKIKLIENESRLEQVKQFAVQKNLNDEMRYKLRYYYNNLRLRYQELNDKHQQISDLPDSIQGELSLLLNSRLIQSVKFFQLASPAFILQMARFMRPVLCIKGEVVVQEGEVATCIYFIDQGLVEVIASDEITKLAYMSCGGYFGEIGVLLLGKRSVTVRTRATSILFQVMKSHLDVILDAFPAQAKFLRAVGRQRQKTTHLVDIQTESDPKTTKARIDDQNLAKQDIDDLKKPVKKMGDMDIFISKKVQALDLGNLLNQKATSGGPTTSLINSSSTPAKAVHEEPDKKKKVEYRMWETEQYNQLKFFLIVPLSQIFYIWATLITLTFAYDLFMVPYSIALNIDFHGAYFVIDGVAIIIYAVDIFIRSRTAMTDPKSPPCFDRIEVMKHYVHNRLMLDLLACIPFEYFMLPVAEFSNSFESIIRYIRLFRLLKMARIFEILEVVKYHSNIPAPLMTMVRMFLIYIVGAHFIACCYIFIGQREYDRATRYDGQSIFGDLQNRNYITLPPPETMQPIEVYGQFLYLASCTMGAVMYGDVIPMAMSEQVFTFCAMIVARMYLAFLFAEAASYLSSLHIAKSSHTQKMNQISAWMQHHNLPEPLIERVREYHLILWKDFQGINEAQILDDLPNSLQAEIRTVLFKPLLNKWELLSLGKDKGAISTLIGKLKMQIIPKGEFIIRAGEVANSVYFIVKGLCKVYSIDGEHQLATLGQGQNFGEMAVMNKEPEIRSASVVSHTNVSLAVLSVGDFKLICDLYPRFKANITKLIEQRQFSNLERQVKDNQMIANHIMFDSALQTPSRVTDKQFTLRTVREEESLNTSSVTVRSEGSQKQVIDSDRQFQEFPGGGAERSNTPPKQPQEKTFENRPLDTGIEEAQQIHNKMLETELQTERNETEEDLLSKQFKIEIPKQDEIKKFSTQILQKKKPGRVQSVDNMRKYATSTQIDDQPLTEKSQKMRKSISYVKKVEQHFDQKQDDDEQTSKTAKLCNLKNFMRITIFVICLYNLLFIPLQFGFRLPFEGWFLFMEILTIFFYMVDLCLHFASSTRIQKLQSITDDMLTTEERRLKTDGDALRSKIQSQKIEILTSILASLPLNCVFYFTGMTRPWWLLVLVSFARLCKLRPLFNFFSMLKTKELNTWRIVEVIVYYYLICNFLACVYLAMASNSEDVRDTWLRRIPVPLDYGIRRSSSLYEGNSIEKMSSASIYLHALYFMVNTISHVAIGDITSVTTSERFLNAFVMLIGTFIYSFLFGNITAIVSSVDPGGHAEFHKRYNEVMGKLRNAQNIPNTLITEVNHYFDYQWNLMRGLDERELFDHIPQSCRSDILLSRFSEAIEKSLLFRDIQADADIDVAMTISILQSMETQVHLQRDFIVKGGSHTTDMIIILEGSVNMFGFFSRGENLGTLLPGSHYGTDLDQVEKGCQPPASIVDTLGIAQTLQNGLELERDDNLESKALVHLCAKTLVVVGKLNRKMVNNLYRVYPNWKKAAQTLNRCMFDLGKLSLEKHIRSQSFNLSRENCLEVLETHITYSTEATYSQIVNDDFNQRTGAGDQKIESLSEQLRRHYIEVAAISNAQKIKIQQALILTNNQNKSMHQHKKDIDDCSFCRGLQIEVNSTPHRLLEVLQLLNLIYIGVATPLCLCYQLRMRGLNFMLEALSLLVSSFVILLRFRTPVFNKGMPTLSFDNVLRHYWHNGLLGDISGMIPLNLILGYYEERDMKQLSGWTIFFVMVLRLTRFSSLSQAFRIFNSLQVYMKSWHVLGTILQAFGMVFLLSHWIACFWFFTTTVIEANVKKTWAIDNSIASKNMGEQYLLCFYTVINVVTSVGYGDMYPVTDIERIFFIVVINIGDVLFALAFGIIGAISMQQSVGDVTKNFMSKMVETDQFMKSFNAPAGQKQRVDQYFAYSFYQQQASKSLDWDDLHSKLPHALAKQCIFYSNRHLLDPMFMEYGSENLMRELSIKLKVVIYLPSDFIINKDSIGDEMYFIAEGSVLVLASDKQTVVNTLRKGAYFGEIAIFCSGQKRTSYIQAETFCVLNSLIKEDLDIVAKTFPLVAKAIKHRALSRLKKIEKINALHERNHETQSEDLHGNDMQDMLKSRLSADASEVSMKPQFMLKKTGSQVLQNKKGSQLDYEEIVHQDGRSFIAKISQPGPLTAQKKTQSFQRGTHQESFESIQAEPKKLKGLSKRRLSGISLSKNLALSTTAGLKLQWTVGGN